MKTNFDQFLEEQLSDPTLAEKFKRANETWDIRLTVRRLDARQGLRPCIRHLAPGKPASKAVCKATEESFRDLTGESKL